MLGSSHNKRPKNTTKWCLIYVSCCLSECSEQFGPRLNVFSFGKKWLHLLTWAGGWKMLQSLLPGQPSCVVYRITHLLSACVFPRRITAGSYQLWNISALWSAPSHIPLYHVLLSNHTPGKFGLKLPWLKGSDDHIWRERAVFGTCLSHS